MSGAAVLSFAAKGGSDLERLRHENRRLADRVSALESLLGADMHLPAEFRLTKMEGRLVAMVYRRHDVSWSQVYDWLYFDRDGDSLPEMPTIRRFLNRVRTKLAPFGIRIGTRYGVGLFMDPDSRKTMAYWLESLRS